MATIVTRAGKGSPLTNTEVDANFTNLNTGKAELSGATFTGEIVAPSLDISGNIDVDGTTNLDVVDIDGAVNMASTLQVDGRVTAAGVTTSAALISTSNSNNLGNTIISALAIDNFTIDGTTIALTSGDMTLDGAGNIILDADGGYVLLKDAGVQYGGFYTSSSDLVMQSYVQDKDIIFYGNDGGSGITALTLDMSAAGAATFNAGVTATKGIFTTTGGDFAAIFTTPLDYVAKFVSTDASSFIILQDSNSTDNANRIGVEGDILQIESGNVENVRFSSASAVFNEGGGDVDFRVESAVSASSLTVEGSSGKVNVAGHFGIGKTSGGEQQSSGSGFFFVPGSSGYYSHISTVDTANFSSYFNRKTQTGGFFNFAVNNVGVGSVTYNGSVTVYGTSSDERLKENITDADDAGSKIDAMQVRKFDWIRNGNHQEYGMVAQELLPISPDSIAQGETEEDMMSVDYSTLVPMLIKEIQSLRQRVASLEE